MKIEPDLSVDAKGAHESCNVRSQCGQAKFSINSPVGVQCSVGMMGNVPHQDRSRGDAGHRVTKIGQAKNCVAREEISVPGCEPFLRLERNFKIERGSLSGSQA